MFFMLYFVMGIAVGAILASLYARKIIQGAYK